MVSVYVSTGRKRDKEKYSWTNVNEEINTEVRAGYVVVYLTGDKFEVLFIVNAGTTPGEWGIGND